MSHRPKIIFHIGGHDFHPVYEQVARMTEWLGPDYLCHSAESLAAFEHVAECDLLVFIGMYYTGWQGRYRSPGAVHQRALERYISSGRPMILFHAAIASYDDWPRFAELTGFGWKRNIPSFAPLGEYAMRVSREIHPVTHQINDYSLHEAPPCGVEIAAGMQTTMHISTSWLDHELPIVISGLGGRMPGAGKSCFIAHGHDMRSFEHPVLRQLWNNAVRWALTPV